MPGTRKPVWARWSPPLRIVRMNRFDHILVIVDPRAKGRQTAVDKAAVLAQSSGASVELLICDVESARADAAITAHARETYPSNTELLNLLDSLAAPLRAQGLRIGVQLIYGESLHESLLDFIRGSTTDLVVKDTHHHSFARRSLRRNTDWHLARGSTVPLLLTKTRPWSRPPIVMAAVDPNRTDKNAAALDRQILRCAASLAGQLAGDLQVIHTYIPAALSAAATTGGKPRDTRETAHDVQVEDAFKYSQIAQLASACGVRPGRLHVEMGTAEVCLIDSVVKYHGDVMVMGASSHGRWHRLIAGSTTSTVVESLPCDVLIVRVPALLRSVDVSR